MLEIASATSAIRGRLSAVIHGWEVACLHASLYGSMARGEAGSTSDIDLLVVRPERLSATATEIWDGQLAELERLVFAWTGNPLSWLDTTRTDLRRAQAAGEPIFQSWRDDAILLTGEPLDALIRRTPGRQRSSAEARNRRIIAAKYLEVAELAATEEQMSLTESTPPLRRP